MCDELWELRAVCLHMKQRAYITSVITFSLWCDNNAMSLCFKPAFRKAWIEISHPLLIKEIKEQIYIRISLFSYDLSSISTSCDIIGEIILNIGEGLILNIVEITSINCLSWWIIDTTWDRLKHNFIRSLIIIPYQYLFV